MNGKTSSGIRPADGQSIGLDLSAPRGPLQVRAKFDRRLTAGRIPQSLRPLR